MYPFTPQTAIPFLDRHRSQALSPDLIAALPSCRRLCLVTGSLVTLEEEEVS
jgi:hypothetical protein